ncbi:BZ3500_MvSof-1268-A1-R1_Chr5-2g08080 [Microbotryum saponariae]|uniref:BZ3500_MvSof-1268-A1-R1_Chr5-2g08080 protein n=1 Tax=Microbotryum saponariae TaxID=289078 RepID=A0A2X0KGF7_9BASI|nr:BZ3500_MvSof-1268-A1-R1_Chr5-2g08080 [Microbotryum saponariae]SDA05949.1 BZ3501_MvSof-1269-A2-R1_Chr5-2g07902 [Microbotryum saponariae]
MSSDQAIRLMNQKLSGMYRRTTTLSLNSPSPAPSSPLASSTNSLGNDDDSTSGTTGDGSTSALSTVETSEAPVASTSASPSTLAPSSSSGQATPTSSSSTTKRKLRSARTSNDPTSTPKRLKPSASAGIAQAHLPPTTRLSDLGGVDKCIESMLELVALPLCHPEVYLHTGVRPPRGVLLVGPPGCGKTMLAGAIAGVSGGKTRPFSALEFELISRAGPHFQELAVPFISISAPSIVSGMSGESEKTLRETFEEAAKLAPCILFIDEIDAITPKRETAQREMERRIVAQLLTCMDGESASIVHKYRQSQAHITRIYFSDLAWDKTDNKPVMILGATNRPDSLDPALRRAGRFDAEITMGVPDEAGRERILRVLMAKLRLSGDFDYAFLAKSTPGYVGADLSALTGAAGVIAVKRIFERFGQDAPRILGTVSIAEGEGQGELVESMGEEMMIDSEAPISEPPSGTTTPNLQAAVEGSGKDTSLTIPPFSSLPPSLAALPIASFLQAHPSALTEDELSSLCLTNEDFTAALSVVQPSSQREGFTTVPNVTWADLGALQQIREEMRMAIVRPIRRPEVFASLGIQAPCGVLLWGPPGCGKTLLAKAVANESRANFISIKGPELLNKYVGESERAVRQVFARARASSPCIIFFDELDALVPRRDDSLSESSARVVNTLLTELDGLEPRKQVFVIGATNRPDILDPAMVRPGRLDKLLYVDLPTKEERIDILRAQTNKTPLGPDVDLASIALDSRCDGFSGADLSALVREAAVMALRDVFDRVDFQDENPSDLASNVPLFPKGAPQITVEMRHFLVALGRTNPSVSVAQRKRFKALRAKFAGQPVGHGKETAEELGGEQASSEGAATAIGAGEPVAA